MKQNTEEMLRGDYTLVEKIAFQTRHTLISKSDCDIIKVGLELNIIKASQKGICKT